jgi:hypothetical protein
MAELVQTAKQKKEAHRQRMEELNTPSPPLDGNALGRALLKNLGLTEWTIRADKSAALGDAWRRP